ncbi:MAG: hypothetical protein IJ244_08490 [Bacteroidaceae bacterium]|nr:hypothetical protein [Bacteroidaceae bacterium]
MKRKVFVLPVLAILLSFAACSEDTSEYESKLPIFSNIVFDSETLYTDMDVQARAVQHSKGKLLDRTQYSWTSTIPNDSTLTWSSTTIYSKDNGDPICKFRTPSVPGSYSITFTGSYNISGQAANGSISGEIPQGTTKYEYTPIKGYVTVRKNFRVLKRP